jgi:hypothetical protein
LFFCRSPAVQESPFLFLCGKQELEAVPLIKIKYLRIMFYGS